MVVFLPFLNKTFLNDFNYGQIKIGWTHFGDYYPRRCAQRFVCESVNFGQTSSVKQLMHRTISLTEQPPQQTARWRTTTEFLLAKC